MRKKGTPNNITLPHIMRYHAVWIHVRFVRVLYMYVRIGIKCDPFPFCENNFSLAFVYYYRFVLCSFVSSVCVCV